MTPAAPDAWDSGDAYERYVGRWSRNLAPRFLAWLRPHDGAAWCDIGCGTGALTAAILDGFSPAAIAAIDASDDFVAKARARINDPRVRVERGDAAQLPWADQSFEYSVSGLVLNFVPQHASMVEQMVRVTKPGGLVALYVWDYAEGMEMMRTFWDVAAEVDANAAQFDEAKRFPVCRPDRLQALFESAGLARTATTAIVIPTVFADFDDFWAPFLSGTGPAPAYLATLPAPLQRAIRDGIAARFTAGGSAPIELSARAWAVRGVVS